MKSKLFLKIMLIFMKVFVNSCLNEAKNKTYVFFIIMQHLKSK